MKKLIIIALLATGIMYACHSPEPTQNKINTTDTTMNSNNPDTTKMKTDTIPRP